MSRRLRRWPVVGAIMIITACSRDALMEPRDMRSGRIPAADSTAAVEAGASIGLKLGETRVLHLSGLLRNRTTEWVSSNPASVSVNSTGTIRANSPGQAVITGTNGGVSQTFNVSVLAPNAAVTGFELSSADSGPLAPGGTRQFTWTATWSDGVTRAVDVEFMATGGTMTAGGLYTAGGVTGTFMVIANCLCGGFSDTVAVEISAIAPPVRQLQKLTISPKTVELEPGVSRQFTVTANWSTGATDVPPVTWSTTGGSVSGSGLYEAPSTPGTYRVVVAHVGGTVRDTATVTVKSVKKPETPEGGQLLFEDGFESGGWGSANGFRWRSKTRTSVSSDKAYSGRYSLCFDYPGAPFGQDGWAEQRFDLGRYTKEIWIEYMLYVPNNFEHRDDEPSNNKFIMIWKDTYGSLSGTWQIGWEYQRYKGHSVGRFMSSRWDEPYVTNTGPWPSPSPINRQALFSNSGGPLIIGQWNQIRFMAKGASNSSAEDGESRLWINGSLFFEYTHGRFYGSDQSKGDATLRNGYLLGWANSGFAQETKFYIDDVKFYLGNPGW